MNTTSQSKPADVVASWLWCAFYCTAFSNIVVFLTSAADFAQTPAIEVVSVPQDVWPRITDAAYDVHPNGQRLWFICSTTLCYFHDGRCERLLDAQGNSASDLDRFVNGADGRLYLSARRGNKWMLRIVEGDHMSDVVELESRGPYAAPDVHVDAKGRVINVVNDGIRIWSGAEWEVVSTVRMASSVLMCEYDGTLWFYDGTHVQSIKDGEVTVNRRCQIDMTRPADLKAVATDGDRLLAATPSDSFLNAIEQRDCSMSGLRLDSKELRLGRVLRLTSEDGVGYALVSSRLYPKGTVLRVPRSLEAEDVKGSQAAFDTPGLVNSLIVQNGHVWMSSRSNGVVQIRDGKVTRFNGRSSRNTNDCNKLVPCGDGRVFGIRKDGIVLLDPRGDFDAPEPPTSLPRLTSLDASLVMWRWKAADRRFITDVALAPNRLAVVAPSEAVFDEKSGPCDVQILDSTTGRPYQSVALPADDGLPRLQSDPQGNLRAMQLHTITLMKPNAMESEVLQSNGPGMLFGELPLPYGQGYIFTDGRTFQRIDERANMLWQRRAGNRAASTQPVLIGDTVVVNGDVMAGLDAATGTVRWTIEPTDNDSPRGAVSLGGDLLLTTTRTNQEGKNPVRVETVLSRCRADILETKWERVIAGDQLGRPLISNDGKRIVTASIWPKGRIQCHNADDGAEVWVSSLEAVIKPFKTTDNQLDEQCLAIDDDYLFVMDTEGTLHIVEAATGAVSERVSLAPLLAAKPEQVYVQRLFAEQDRLIVVGMDEVVALDRMKLVAAPVGLPE